MTKWYIVGYQKSSERVKFGRIESSDSYTSIGAAQEEVKKLSEKHPNEEFLVLEMNS